MTRAELLELLKKARKQLTKYKVPKDEQTITLSIDKLENALSEQPEIVRCKDCKYWDQLMEHRGLCHEFTNTHSEALVTSSDWFCADGGRKEVK